MDASGQIGSTLKFVPTAQCATSLWYLWCSNGRCAHGLIQQRVKTWQVKCCMTTVDLPQAAHMKSTHTLARQACRSGHAQLWQKTGSPVQDNVHFLQISKVGEGITELGLCGGEGQVAQEQPACRLFIFCNTRTNAITANTGTTAVTADHHCCHC